MSARRWREDQLLGWDKLHKAWCLCPCPTRRPKEEPQWWPCSPRPKGGGNCLRWNFSLPITKGSSFGFVSQIKSKSKKPFLQRLNWYFSRNFDCSSCEFQVSFSHNLNVWTTVVIKISLVLIGEFWDNLYKNQSYKNAIPHKNVILLMKTPKVRKGEGFTMLESVKLGSQPQIGGQDSSSQDCLMPLCQPATICLECLLEERYK